MKPNCLYFRLRKDKWGINPEGGIGLFVMRCSCNFEFPVAIIQCNYNAAIAENPEGVFGGLLLPRVGVRDGAKAKPDQLNYRTLAGSTASDQNVEPVVKMLVEAIKHSTLYAK
jgi:hypothetical protein